MPSEKDKRAISMLCGLIYKKSIFNNTHRKKRY